MMILEVFFIALFIFHVIRGYQRGFILQLTWLIAGVIVVSSWSLFQPIVGQILAWLQINESATLFSQWIQLILGYFLIYFGLQLILRLSKNLKIPVLTPLNRICGAILGFVKASWFLFLGAQAVKLIVPAWFVVIAKTQVYSWLLAGWEPLTTTLMQWLSQL